MLKAYLYFITALTQVPGDRGNLQAFAGVSSGDRPDAIWNLPLFVRRNEIQNDILYKVKRRLNAVIPDNIQFRKFIFL
jgi:hypothetical protein